MAWRAASASPRGARAGAGAPQEERAAIQRLAEEASKTSATPVSPEQIVERWFVQHAKVHLNAGSSYGTGGAGHMRMNVATSRRLLELALTNMAAALKNPQMSMA